MRTLITNQLKTIAIVFAMVISGASMAQTMEWQEWVTEGTDGKSYEFRDLTTDGRFTVDLYAENGRVTIFSARDEFVMTMRLIEGTNSFDLDPRNSPYMCMVKTHDFNHIEVLRIAEERSMDATEIIEGVSIYPNPASDQISLDIEKGQEGIFRILDMNGNTMSETNLNQGLNVIEVVDLPKGFYVTEHISDQGVRQVTLLKE